MTTETGNSLRLELNKANPNTLASAAQPLDLGNMLSLIKVVATSLTGAASFDITTDAVKAASTITGANLKADENLPPIGVCLTLRVTTATTGSFVGTYVLTDGAGDMATAATHTVAGVARISDDGKTLTFPTADVTGFTLQYMPRAAVALTTAYPST